jgi:hypothetical protein
VIFLENAGSHALRALRGNPGAPGLCVIRRLVEEGQPPGFMTQSVGPAFPRRAWERGLFSLFRVFRVFRGGLFSLTIRAQSPASFLVQVAFAEQVDAQRLRDLFDRALVAVQAMALGDDAAMQRRQQP